MLPYVQMRCLKTSGNNIFHCRNHKQYAKYLLTHTQTRRVECRGTFHCLCDFHIYLERVNYQTFACQHETENWDLFSIPEMVHVNTNNQIQYAVRHFFLFLTRSRSLCTFIFLFKMEIIILLLLISQHSRAKFTNLVWCWAYPLSNVVCLWRMDSKCHPNIFV